MYLFTSGPGSSWAAPAHMGPSSFMFQEPVDSGRSGGARTPNPRFWRPVLYQLSYTPILGRKRLSLYDLGDDAGADGATAFADRKAQPLVHRDRGDQFDLHRDVVARHHHLGAFRQMHRAGHIGRAEIELRPVIAEKR